MPSPPPPPPSWEITNNSYTITLSPPILYIGVQYTYVLVDSTHTNLQQVICSYNMNTWVHYVRNRICGRTTGDHNRAIGPVPYIQSKCCADTAQIANRTHECDVQGRGRDHGGCRRNRGRKGVYKVFHLLDALGRSDADRTRTLYTGRSSAKLLNQKICSLYLQNCTHL